MSTVCPFLINGPKRSPSPYTSSPTESESSSFIYGCLALFSIYPVDLERFFVMAFPLPRNVLFHLSPRSTVTERSPLSRTASFSCMRIDGLNDGSYSSGKFGLLSRLPSKWEIRTRITFFMGLEYRTVRSCILSVSPLCRIGFSGAYTTSSLPCCSISAGHAAKCACIPSFISQ